MELLKYIFGLGIVFIVFSLIWGFFMFLYRLITGFQSRGRIEIYIFQLVNLYLLVSLSAMQTLEYIEKPQSPRIFLTIIGMLVLYSYLTGRLERRRLIIQFNNRQVVQEKPNLAAESLSIIASLVYFSFCLTHPHIMENDVNLWFYGTIREIYDTPVIGWIIGLIGVFFLLIMLIKSVVVTAGLISSFMDILSGNYSRRNRNDDDRHDNDGGFTDYEEIRDDRD